MRTETKRRARNLVAAIAICGASLALLPGVAQAQGLNVGPVTSPVTAQVDDVIGADSQTDTTQGVSTNEPSLVTGGVTDTTAVEAPVAPVQGTVAVDETVGVPGVVEEDVCLNGAVNAQPGTCGGAATPPPAPAEDETGVDSQTEAPQTVSTDEESLVTGGVTDTTGVNAPIVPVQGTVGVDETVEVPGVVEEDVCLNVGVNEAPGACSETPPDPNPDDMTVDDVIETIDDVVNDSSDDVVVDVEADAPVPVETGADAQVDAVVDEVADLGVCADVDVNQDTPGCQTDETDGGVDLPETPLPENDGPDLDADAGVGDDIGAGVCLDGVLGEDGSCDEETADGNGGDQDGLIDACVGVLDSGICQQDDGDQGNDDGGLIDACVGILDPGCNEGSGETPIADVCIGILAPACPNAADIGDNGPGDDNGGGGDPGDGDDPGDGNNGPGDDSNDPGDGGNDPGDNGGNDGGDNGDGGNDPDDGSGPDGNGNDGNGNGNDDGSGPGSDDDGNADDVSNVSNSSDMNDGGATNGGAGSSAFTDYGFVDASADGGANGLLSSGEVILLSGTGGAISQDSATSIGDSDGAGQDDAATSGLDQLPDTGGANVETLKFVFGAFLLALGLTGFMIALRRREAL